MGLIIKANSTVERLPLLLELREKLEGLQVLLRISKEVRAFNSFNSYVYGSNLVVELSRQNEGWIKSQSSQRKGDAGSGQHSRPDGQAGERARLHHGASAPPE